MTIAKKSIETKLLIPSFSASTALFAQHFSILRELKKNIDDLKKQMPSQNSNNECIKSQDGEHIPHTTKDQKEMVLEKII